MLLLLVLASLSPAKCFNVTDDILLCYACGLHEIDPEQDQPGSFGDARRSWIPEGKKMYNYTCDIARDLGGLDDKWLRKCPPFSLNQVGI